MKLTTDERIAVRALADRKYDQVSNTMLGTLHSKGLVKVNGTLSAKGQREYRNIMSSGDGPEGLKAMFRI